MKRKLYLYKLFHHTGKKRFSREHTKNPNANVWACQTSHFGLWDIIPPPPPPPPILKMLKISRQQIHAESVTNFGNTDNQCGPRSDCSYKSSLIWVHTVLLQDRFNGLAEDTADNIKSQLAAEAIMLWFEPPHEISNNVVWETRKDSDQPELMRSLIRAFASCLNILWVLSYWLNIIWSF